MQLKSYKLLFWSTMLLVACASCREERAAAHADSSQQTTGHPRNVQLTSYPAFSPQDIPAERLHETIELFAPDESMTIPSLLHCIRLDRCADGAAAAIDDLTKQEILERVLQHSRFRNAYRAERAYLVPTQHGARFSEIPWSPSGAEIDTREAHWGQTLCVLAELGLSATEPIETSGGPATLQAVIDDAVANFTYDVEPYWVTPALAIYLSPQTGWTNKFGHRFTFSEVAQHLMSQPPGESGPCGGTHVLYTLAVLLQAHDQHGILDQPGTPQAVRDYLKAAAGELALTQAEDGSWDDLWTSQQREEADRQFTVRFAKNASHYVWMTGHHLEWQALVPPELRVPPERLAAAANFVLRHTNSREAVIQELCRYSHGIRAIQLLLGAGDDG